MRRTEVGKLQKYSGEFLDVKGPEFCVVDYQVSRSGLYFSGKVKTLETGVTCGMGTNMPKKIMSARRRHDQKNDKKEKEH